MPWINLGELDSARKYIEKNTLDLERSHSDDIASHALNYAYQFILGVKENKPVDISRLGQYCDSLYTVKSQTEKAERERLVDQNRLRRENLRLENQPAAYVLYLSDRFLAFHIGSWWSFLIYP